MTITISIPKEHNGMYARIAGSMVELLQQFNGEHNVPIYLIYEDHPKVDAMSIVNWLEFSIHEHKTFVLESSLPNMKDLEIHIKDLFGEFVV